MKEYHILSLSGGKDSTALAFYIRDNMPEIHEQIEYVFYDTGCELPETYDYLDKIEVFLDKKITRVKPDSSFDDFFASSGVIPSVFRRWCTIVLKVRPSVKFINDKLKKHGDGIVNLYVGIRADETSRKGVQLVTEIERKYIKPVYPFIENGINKKDVENILNTSGISYPDYYKWRDRNGCYFCFYQSELAWINLYEHHPDLFFKAVDYENQVPMGRKKRFGWNEKKPLIDMIEPDNIKAVKEKYKKLFEQRAKKQKELSGNTFFDIDDNDDNKCVICHI